MIMASIQDGNDDGGDVGAGDGAGDSDGDDNGGNGDGNDDIAAKFESAKVATAWPGAALLQGRRQLRLEASLGYAHCTNVVRIRYSQQPPTNTEKPSFKHG